MIEAHDLSRRYGDFTAVDRVSFAVGEREILGMLGPNGAGKTTTIRMITGFLPPSSGRVTVGGKDLFATPQEARRQIGYLPENIALYPEMRVSEYLAYRASLEGMSGPAARAAIGEAIDRCLLDDVRGQIIGTLSKGYRQRVGLATAILHQPRVLVLDEPTVGLDPKQIIAIRELIRELGRERTLLLSTHILSEVELLCNRVMIIDRGRIVAEGEPESLRDRLRGNPTLRVGFKGDPPDAALVLGGLPGVVGVRPGAGAGPGSGPGSGHYVVECAGDTDPREEIFRAAVARGWVLLELMRDRASLEDVFVRLTTRDVATPVDEDGEETSLAGTAAAEPAAPGEHGENGERNGAPGGAPPAERAGEAKPEVPS
jgi:ABC-2 type transport system ATP-binding protein